MGVGEGEKGENLVEIWFCENSENLWPPLEDRNPLEDKIIHP